MPTLRRLHAATSGTKQTRSGQKLTLLSSDLDELAQSYRPDLHSCKVAVDDVTTAIRLGAPAVLGHLDPALVQAKGAMPAFGRILSAETDPYGLWLDVELTDSMAEYMQQGLYDHVSLSWYDRDDRRNPTPGKLHMRHLGILGAEGSAMKDLELPDTDMIEFSDGSVYHSMKLTTPLTIMATNMTSTEPKKVKVANDMAEGDTETTVEAVAEATDAEPETEATVDPVQLLIDTLYSGDKGYKGEITGFIPEPTADNSYLYDADKQMFAGQFLDDSGNELETYDFTLQLEDDGSMTRKYKRVFDAVEDEAPANDATVEAEADAADAPLETEMGEGFGEAESVFVPEVPDMPQALITLSTTEYDSLLAQSHMYKQLQAEMAERDRQDKAAQIESALEPLYSMGLVSQSLAPGDVARALMAMSEDADCCDDDSYGYEFSESNGSVTTHTSGLETVVALFSQIAANAKLSADTEIEFGEMCLPDKPKEMGESAVMPVGSVANSDQARIDKAARQYCKDKGLDPKDSKSYIKAVKAVS